MAASSLGRSKARRAARERRTDATATAGSFSDDSGIRDIVTHGLAALAISALGLGVVGTIGLTSSAQADTTSTTSSLTANAPDVTRAEPAVKTKGLSQENRAAIAQEQAATDDSADTGSLDAFSRRADSTSRNSVRVGLDRAMAAEQAKNRSSSLSAESDKVAQTSRTAVSSARNSNLKASQSAIKAENDRLKKAKEEAEKKKKEAAAGELTAAPVAAAPAAAGAGAGAVDTSAVSGSGGAKPIAAGKYRIAARWGATGSWARYHTGIDLSAPIGTPIHAAADGVVQGPASGAGWAGVHVVIKHSDGQTLYAHMARTTVNPGQSVKAGQIIGYVGMTGRTFGPHCHFEFYPNGTTPGDVYSNKDPYAWMLTRGVQL